MKFTHALKDSGFTVYNLGMRKVLLSFLFILQYALPSYVDAQVQHLEIINEKVQISKKNLNLLSRNRKNIIGVEYLYADSTKAKIESRWGHALLKFVDNDNDWRNDIVISFVALVTDEQLDSVKGLTGGYKLFPQISTFGYFYSQYTEVEGRDLVRKVIQTTPEQRGQLIDELAKWEKDPDHFGNYTFFENNCAGSLSTLFMNAGLLHFKSDIRSPSSFASWLESGYLSTVPEMRMKNIFQLIRQLSRVLGFDVVKFSNKDLWPEDVVQILQKNFTADEIILIDNYLPTLPGFVSLDISSMYRSRIEAIKKSGGVSHLLGNQFISKNLYGVCLDKGCSNNFRVSLQNFFSAKELHDMNKVFENKEIYVNRTLRQLRVSKNPHLYEKYNNFVSSNQYHHHQLILGELKELFNEK